MTVRVNLLPSEVQERGEANRARIAAAVLGLLFLAVLAAATLWQRGQIADAEETLAAVEATNSGLQADVAVLQPFADLETRARSAVELTQLALADEASVATILQDLSAVFPPNAELTSVDIEVLDEPESPSAGGERVIYGRLAASGRVLDGVAPGVERLIIDLDRVAAFDNALVTTSAVDDEGVVTFALEVELGPEVRTERYAGGAGS